MKQLSKNKYFVLGCDFGSDSVRVVIIDAFDGSIAGTAVDYYERWKKGLYCNAKENQFRQHPLDYTESLTRAIHASITQGVAERSDAQLAQKICSICIDTTGSTPCLTDKNGMPLVLSHEFSQDSDAMFILWKDHSAVKEAEEITSLAHQWGANGQPDYTAYCGGTYSAEWFWSKILHIVRANSQVKEAVFSAVEHCDWITALLTGTVAPEKIKRSRCAAGHKCLWHKSWGGYPSTEFLAKLHPRLADIGSTLGTDTWTTETRSGGLTEEWAAQLGLKTGICVCVGAYDAHIGAVGGGIERGVMVKSIGTSTCDIIIADVPKNDTVEKPISGICGQVNGSVIAGYIGYEAGQSAYGDYFAWFRNICAWAYEAIEKPDENEKELFEKKFYRCLKKRQHEKSLHTLHLLPLTGLTADVHRTQTSKLLPAAWV